MKRAKHITSIAATSIPKTSISKEKWDCTMLKHVDNQSSEANWWANYDSDQNNLNVWELMVLHIYLSITRSKEVSLPHILKSMYGASMYVLEICIPLIVPDIFINGASMVLSEHSTWS